MPPGTPEARSRQDHRIVRITSSPYTGHVRLFDAQFFCTFGAFPNQHVYPPRDTRVSPPEQTIWIIAALTCGHSCLSLTI
ncbi:uncharacterized protein [Dendrobates tinctorius]|uniref:uncharacterized protein isoform X4 n=1 Tax=Dendrobates tinctorius TaxID=92724 RepID=UPI003CCA692A